MFFTVAALVYMSLAQMHMCLMLLLGSKGCKALDVHQQPLSHALPQPPVMTLLNADVLMLLLQQSEGKPEGILM